MAEYERRGTAITEATANDRRHRMRGIGKTPEVVWGDALDDA
jgi:hypothetical protein